MKTIRVSGVLYESLQSEGYYVPVDLDIGDDEKIISCTPSLIEGPRPWPPTGDYKLTYFYGGQRHEAHGHIERQTWQQAIFGVV